MNIGPMEISKKNLLELKWRPCNKIGPSTEIIYTVHMYRQLFYYTFSKLINPMKI